MTYLSGSLHLEGQEAQRTRKSACASLSTSIKDFAEPRVEEEYASSSFFIAREHFRDPRGAKACNPRSKAKNTALRPSMTILPDGAPLCNHTVKYDGLSTRQRNAVFHFSFPGGTPPTPGRMLVNNPAGILARRVHPSMRVSPSYRTTDLSAVSTGDRSSLTRWASLGCDQTRRRSFSNEEVSCHRSKFAWKHFGLLSASFLPWRQSASPVDLRPISRDISLARRMWTWRNRSSRNTIHSKTSAECSDAGAFTLQRPASCIEAAQQEPLGFHPVSAGLIGQGLPVFSCNRERSEFASSRPNQPTQHLRKECVGGFHSQFLSTRPVIGAFV